MTQIPHMLSPHTLILMEGQILAEKETKYQAIVIMQTPNFGKILMIEGVVQFSEKDEAIYHEALAHPIMSMHENPKKVLIVGGGDGGILREVLKHPIKSATLVDIDEELIKLTRKHIPIAEKAFKDPRTKIIIEDGKKFVLNTKEKFDIIILDLGDPEGPSVQLFTKDFYEQVKKILEKKGIIVTQVDSLTLQPQVSGSSMTALKQVFKETYLYNAFIQSFFTINGFCIASDQKLKTKDITKNLKQRKIKLKAHTAEQIQDLLKTNAYTKSILEKKWKASTEKNPVQVLEETSATNRIKEALSFLKKHGAYFRPSAHQKN